MASELSVDIVSVTLFEVLGYPKLSDAMSAADIRSLTRTRLMEIVDGDKESKVLQQKWRAALSDCGGWVAAHLPTVLSLTNEHGHWEIATTWLLEWMAMMGVRDWLADVIDGEVSIFFFIFF